MRMDAPKKDLSVFLLYMFSFLLLWEWLRPLTELTDTDHLEVFLLFVLVSLLMSFFGMPVIPAIMIKTIFLLYSVHLLFFDGAFFSGEWFGKFIENLASNAGLLANSEWTEMTSMLRTVLFFILLWLMSYLIRYWLISRKQIFVFFFMTLIYITVLDTFTPYDADIAIIRTVIAGFTVMGMLAYSRILDRERITKSITATRRWMIPFIMMIVFSVGIGYAVPKTGPIWPDPVPFLTSANDDSGGGGIKKVGYSTDDSSLGGPFLGDDRVVFTAEAESRHYWRIETKELYTGKGWLVEKIAEMPVYFLPKQTVPLDPFEEGVTTETRTSRVIPEMNYPHVVYPLGVYQINPSATKEVIEFSMDPTTEKILSLEDGTASSIGPYTILYDRPVYSVEKMKGEDGEQNIFAEEHPAFYTKYTQLPGGLPGRIGDLAAEIAEGKDNWFDEAKAIESFFRSNEFTYDQTNVAVPEDDQDYVDQFVFETKQGYCDNFSTSMIVMLRSLGIPSRWVKGYTDGEQKISNEDGKKVYEITNNNAHSWVEVYFPGVGWVPFEPTQGFSNNVQFEYNLKNNSENQPEQESQKDQQKSKPQKPELEDGQEPTGNSELTFSKILKNIGGFLNRNLMKILLVVLLLSVLAGVLYGKRAQWMPSFYILLYKYKKENKHLEKAYLALLNQLARYGLKRANGQTLRDYAEYVDKFFSSKEMRMLTAKYEEYLYGGKTDERMWEEVKKHWEIMIKKASA